MMDQSQAARTPLVKALSKPKWFRHANMEVRIMVSSCLSEILRVFSLKVPSYDDDILRTIYQLLVDSFEGLRDVTCSHFSWRVAILETFAKARMSCILLDLDMNELVYEMFHHFIASAIEEHASNVIETMRDIINRIIEESNYIDQTLVSMLLNVWRQDLVASTTAHELVNSVIKQCERKLKPFLGNEKTKEEEQPKGEESQSAVVNLSHEEACKGNKWSWLILKTNQKSRRQRLH